MNLKEIFNDHVIDRYKRDKTEITDELLQTLRSQGNEGKQIALDILETEKSDDNYYLDAFGDKIFFNADRELKKAYTKMKLSDIHVTEIKKCADNIDYFLENYVKIRTKDGTDFPELRSYQKGFLDALTSDYESVVSLQPRQSGKSITTSIYLTHKFVFDHDKNIGICANKGALAVEFLKNVKNIFLNLPMWMKVGVSMFNGGQIESENKMRILTSAPGENSFRGFTLSILVVDETAFIRTDTYKQMIDSVAPSQSALAWKKNIYISTANGMNHFYDLVEGAKKRKVYKDVSKEEYEKIRAEHKVLDVKDKGSSYDVTIDEPSNGFLFYNVDWRDVPRYDVKGNVIPPDKFKESVVDKYGLVYFNQNYANQFLGSSYTLLDAKVLEKYKALEPVDVWDDRLRVYKQPEKGHKYIIGVDGAKGANDAFVVQIVDITKLPFEQVATFREFKCQYQIMPAFIVEWSERFNSGLLIIENNEGSGTFVANMLDIDYSYENLYYDRKSNSYELKNEPGFRTTSKTRPQILDTLQLFANNDKLLIHDKDTIQELRTFIIKNNKYQADDGFHDDTVMSLALCFAPFINNRNFDDMKEVIKNIVSNENNDFDITESMALGNFDDFTDFDSGEVKVIFTKD